MKQFANYSRFKMRKYFIFYLFSILNGIHSSTIVNEACDEGDACLNCPVTHYRHMDDGKIICCKGCVNTPFNSCYCYINTTKTEFPLNENDLQPKERILTKTNSISSYDNHLNRNPLYPTKSISSNVDKAIIQELYDLIEILSNRVQYLENIHGIQNEVNRNGLEANANLDYLSSDYSSYCSSTSFDKVGDKCIYFSSKYNKRQMWLEANKTCFEMSGILVETTTLKDFEDLIGHIKRTPNLSGNSFWTGGFYPGISWRWYYNGTEVTRNTKFWTSYYETNSFKPPKYTDIDYGKCLVLKHVYNIYGQGEYAFQPGQCGYEKFFMCEELPPRHRSMFK